MICFIPAWYAAGQWKENEQQWYIRRMYSETEDTVKQIQLFERNSEYKLRTLILNYAPNFRHFLHRQGLLHTDYWSCFDAIQEIRTRQPGILSMHQIHWPEGVEFLNSSFAVIVMLHGVRFAQVEFGEDGNMIQIDMYRDGVICRRNVYDDRGFLSSTIVYKNGVMAYEQYLNEKGLWKICQYADGHVEVNPKLSCFLIKNGKIDLRVPFQKQRYESMEEVLSEVFLNYLKTIRKDTVFFVAMHSRHSALLSDALKNRKTIVSFYNDRCLLQNDEASRKLTLQADYVIVDSKRILHKTGLDKLPPETKIMDITPFDSRVDFGHSQQLHQQNILLAVDHLEDSDFEKMIVLSMQYMEKNSNARVHLFTRNALYSRENDLLNKTGLFLKKHGYDPDHARVDRTEQFENDIDERAPILFYVRQCVDELSASKCIQEQRIIVDMGSMPDLFLQIGGISMGIPQIARHKSEYVINHKNGRILKEVSELPEIFHYYLDTFEHWNEASVESYEIGKQFNSEVLVERWRKVIDYVESN